MKKRRLKKGVKKFFCLVLFIVIVIVAFLWFSKDINNNNSEKKEAEKSILSQYGYSDDEIKLLEKKLNDEIISEIDSYDKDLAKYIESDYFIYGNLERYKNYADENEYDVEKIVMYVNIGIDQEFYTNIKKVNDPDSLLVLSNKYNALPSDYEPNDLEQVGYSGKYMRKEAAENMTTLQKDAKKDGVTINMISGYRSYDYQDGLYSKYVKRDGKEEADTYSARPGHSEHQTGLAMDVSDHTWTCEESFDKSEQFAWLDKNAYKYGFIMRYPKGKEFITGYTYEPWHYRYVGVEAATIIHEEGITYEEYVVKYLTSY